MAFSCKKNDIQAVIDGAVSSDVVVIPSTGGEFTIVFTSDRMWRLRNEISWIMSDVASGGEGTTQIHLKVNCNTTRLDRVAEIGIVAMDGSFDNVITVRQDCPYLRIDESLLEKNFEFYESGKGGYEPFDIPIESNVKWVIQEIPKEDDEAYGLSNFVLSEMEGMNDDTLSIQPLSPNYGLAPYEAEFIIVPMMESSTQDGLVEIPEEAADRYTVVLSQDNFIFLLNGNPGEFSMDFSELADMDSSLTVEIEAERDWYLAEKPEWVMMEPEAGGSTTVTISPDGVTPTSEERVGSIIMRVDFGAENVTREIQVRQNGYVFEFLEEPDVEFASDDTLARSVVLRTTGPWEILGIPEWLEVSPVSCADPSSVTGVSEHEISLRVLDENLDFEDIVSDITFSRTRKPYNVTEDPMDINEHVVHKAFVFEMQPSEVLTRIPTFNTREYPLIVRSSGDWIVESVSDWINISGTAGTKGVDTVMVNAMTANPDLDNNREGVIEFVSVKHRDLGIDVRREVNIMQRQYVFEFNSDNLQNIPAYKSVYPAYEARLSCSAEWQLVDWPDWLEPDVTSGDGMEDVDISFTPEYNGGKTRRTGTVRFRDNYMQSEISATVTQDAFVFDDSDVTFRDIPVMNEESYRVSANMTSEAPWVLAFCSEWLNPSSYSGSADGSGTLDMSFTPSPNPELRTRTGSAVISSTISNEEKTIEFVQDPYLFDDSREEFHYTELSTISNRIQILCSGPWTAEAPSWINVTPSSGQTSGQISVSVSKNTSLDDRNGSVIVTSTQNGLTKEITVEQDAYEFDDRSESFEFEAMDNNEEDFDVLCSGGWSIFNFPQWVVLSVQSGTGSEDGDVERVTLSVQDNLTASDRNATLILRSDDNSSLSKRITVSQERFVLTLSMISCTFTADDSKRLRCDVECSDDWEVEAEDDWVIVSNVTSTGFYISVDENESTERRTSVITVWNERSGLSQSISVIQYGVED